MENTTGEKQIEAVLKKHRIKFEKRHRLTSLKKDSKKYRIPDFYLPGSGLCIEYFGSWDLPSKSLRARERLRFLEKLAVYELNKVWCIYLYPNTLKYAEKIILTMIEKIKIKREVDRGGLEDAKKGLVHGIEDKIHTKVFLVKKEHFKEPHWVRFLIFALAGSLLTLFFVLLGMNIALFFPAVFAVSNSMRASLLLVLNSLYFAFVGVTLASIAVAAFHAHRKYIISGFLNIFFVVAIALVALSLINLVFNPVFLDSMFLAFFTVMIVVPVEAYMAWSRE